MAETIALFSGDPGEGEALRRLEAVLFAAPTPLTEVQLAARLPEDEDVSARLAQLQTVYANRGVNLVQVADGWAFRTAPDLAPLMQDVRESTRRLSRAALETLAIIAYHQPVTRAEIEEIRGVAVAKGTLDILLESGWVRLRGRRRAPGRPVTFGTTPAFLDHFSLSGIADLPGLDDLKGAGLLEGKPPAGFSVPVPRDDDTLLEDEDPLDGDGDHDGLDDEGLRGDGLSNEELRGDGLSDGDGADTRTER